MSEQSNMQNQTQTIQEAAKQEAVRQVAESNNASPSLFNEKNSSEDVVNEESDHSASTGRPNKPDNLFDQRDESIPSRPDWLPEKFKSVEDLNKSYIELEKKLGAFRGAPEEYKLELPEELSQYDYDGDSAFVSDFKQLMKENNVSQDLYQKITECHLNYLRAEDEMASEAKNKQYQQDISELGETGVKEIREATKWAAEVLPAEDYELLSELGDFDVSVGKLVKHFYDAFKNKSYVHLPASASQVNSVEDRKVKAQEMMSDPRYGRDDNYTKKVDNFYKELYGE